ncbi:MAG: ABC transporter substrate-binding protein [Saprospiraceae bacterium]|nr:ABC transporter substrate-binding protein [Saprospiraceae bacterium]
MKPKMNLNYSLFFIGMILCFLQFSMSSCDPTKRNGQNNTRDTITTNKIDTNRLTIDTTTPVDIEPDRIRTVNWCDTVQKTRFEQYVICYTKKGSEPIIADTIKVLRVDPGSLFNQDTTRTINKKASYNVAIMLPFMTNLFKTSAEAELSPKSLRAVEFYEGMQLALDSLRKMGVNLNIKVYDTKKSATTVDALLLKEDIKNADVIIGPISSKLIPKVAEFTKENGQVLISPFNPRISLVQEHPSYMQLNPSYNSHSKRIIQFIESQDVGTKVVLLGMAKDTGRIQLLQEQYAIARKDENARLPQYIASSRNMSLGNIQKYLSSTALNIIVIPSYKDEVFIYNSLRELHSLIDLVETRKSHKVIVIGMPAWKYYERMNMEYYENLNLHITSEFFIDTENQLNTQFKTVYKTTYGIAPRHYAYIGFDLAIYTGYMLHKYGTEFHKFLEDEPMVRRHTEFKFKEHYKILTTSAEDNGGNGDLLEHKAQLSRYENEHVNLLEFDDYKFQKVE